MIGQEYRADPGRVAIQCFDAAERCDGLKSMYTDETRSFLAIVGSPVDGSLIERLTAFQCERFYDLPLGPEWNYFQDDQVTALLRELVNLRLGNFGLEVSNIRPSRETADMWEEADRRGVQIFNPFAYELFAKGETLLLIYQLLNS